MYHDYIEQRTQHLYTCEADSSRPTTFGAELLQHDLNPLRPRNVIGDPLFSIQMETSTDCARWIPEGYNIDATKRSSTGIQTFSTTSLTSSSHAKTFKFGAGVAVAVSKFHASAGYEQDTATSQQQLSKQKKQYFYTWIESIDNILSFSFAQPPEYSDSFLDMFKNFDNQTVHFDFLSELFEIYSHFPKRLQLGSRFMEIRSISESDVKTVEEKKDNKGINAEVGVNFRSVSADGSFGYGEGTTKGSAQETLNRHSQTFRTTVGENPDFSTWLFDTAKHPGIIDVELGSVCEVLPVKDYPLTRTLRKPCIEFAHSKAFCYTALPRVHYMDGPSVQDIQEHMIQMRTFRHCHDLPPALFDARFVEVEEEDMDFHDCVMTALRGGAQGVSFQRDKCYITIDNTHHNHTMQKCDSDCVTIRFKWPTRSNAIPLLKKTVVYGEFLDFISRSYFIPEEEDICTLWQAARGLGSNATLQDSDMDNLNRYLHNALLGTLQDKCELTCAATEGCQFVHKRFDILWFMMGLNEWYKMDNTLPTFRETCDKDVHPIIFVDCKMFYDVHFTTILRDKATWVDENFGNIVTSLLIRADSRPNLRTHGLTHTTKAHRDCNSDVKCKNDREKYIQNKEVGHDRISDY